MFAVDRSNWGNQPWLLITAGDLDTERRQCLDEGKDIAALEPLFAELSGADLTDEATQRRAEALLDQTMALPIRAEYPRREPSDLAGIQAERPTPVAFPACTLSEAQLLDKALGGWRGRASGCLLGKPVEGKFRRHIETYLRSQNRWPLDAYFSNQADPEIAKDNRFDLKADGLYEENITCMVEDDDTNYTTTGLAIVKQFGPNFTPADVARFWLGNIPIFHVCTAERIAYKNLVSCIPPPLSGQVRNVYREWIGAQIRADFFGFVNPGQPERAADYAWRDACISHVKNGIYGEMWVAAMLAAAYVCDDVATVIRAGLAQIPATSRLTEGIEHVLARHAAGISYEAMVDDLCARWDENVGHHWCHTISNAEIVALALLWGEKDFGKTICYSVMPGLDTDCNGATAGSVLGVMLGGAALPARWIDPLQDTLLTGVAGYHRVSLTQMAEETVALMRTGDGVTA